MNKEKVVQACKDLGVDQSLEQVPRHKRKYKGFQGLFVQSEFDGIKVCRRTRLSGDASVYVLVGDEMVGYWSGDTKDSYGIFQGLVASLQGQNKIEGVRAMVNLGDHYWWDEQTGNILMWVGKGEPSKHLGRTATAQEARIKLGLVGKPKVPDKELVSAKVNRERIAKTAPAYSDRITKITDSVKPKESISDRLARLEARV